MTEGEQDMSLDEEVVEQLKKSIETAGQLYLIYKDVDTGEIVAGKHRAEACKRLGREPKTITIRFTSPKSKLLFGIHSNIQRSISKEERAEQLNELARILQEEEKVKGSLVGRIVEITPFSEQYIRSLLKDEYKRGYIPQQLPERDIATEKRIGGEAHPRRQTFFSKSPPQPIPCPKCKGSLDITSETSNFKDSWLQCNRCSFKADYKPPPPPELAEMMRKVEVQVRRPTQEEIKERMRAPISTVDVEVPALLSEMGVSGFQTQQEICIYSLIPDVLFPQQRIAVFFDGPGHPEDPEEEEMREALKRRGWRVLELRYTTLSGEVKRELARQVAEEVGFTGTSEPTSREPMPPTTIPTYGSPTTISVPGLQPIKYQCPYCGAWFVSEEDLDAHQKSCYLDIPR